MSNGSEIQAWVCRRVVWEEGKQSGFRHAQPQLRAVGVLMGLFSVVETG